MLFWSKSFILIMFNGILSMKDRNMCNLKVLNSFKINGTLNSLTNVHSVEKNSRPFCPEIQFICCDDED